MQALVVVQGTVAFPGPDRFEPRQGRAQIAPEGLSRTGMLAANSPTPARPGLKQSSGFDAVIWSYFALFADEGADRTAEFLKLPHHVERRVCLDEIPAVASQRTTGVDEPRELIRRAIRAFGLGGEEAAVELRDLIDAFNELHPETLRIGSVNPAD
jgi:hypothetical protein